MTDSAGQTTYYCVSDRKHWQKGGSGYYGLVEVPALPRSAAAVPCVGSGQRAPVLPGYAPRCRPLQQEEEAAPASLPGASKVNTRCKKLRARSMHSHDNAAWEFNGWPSMVYRGILGRSSTFRISSTFFKIGDPVHRKIHKRGRCCIVGLEEAFSVSIIGIQFTPDWFPLDVQPFNQTFTANGRLLVALACM